MSIKDRGAKMQDEKMTTIGNNVNKSVTIYGHDDIHKFMVDNFINEGNDEFRYNNISMEVLDYYLNVRIYTDSINRICVASIVLNYDDFAMRYRSRGNDIKLLSRTGDKVSDKMYIHLI
jgi:hypothetical protein